jgi:hypothetical protein
MMRRINKIFLNVTVVSKYESIKTHRERRVTPPMETIGR